ncbi:hypothetical protein BTVI_109453 [Pitangus sulphuratus]|nr:hypothetical protein BTVI_109453 [Pitangus sulphuratus]
MQKSILCPSVCCSCIDNSQSKAIITSKASSVTDNRPRGSQYPELEDHDCKNDQLSADLEIVWDLLLQLDPYKSMGPDGIHARILKDLADVITQPLSVIFEESWESRGAPNWKPQADWKLANTVPVFKKGKKEDPRNYRPVSLTSAWILLDKMSSTQLDDTKLEELLTHLKAGGPAERPRQIRGLGNQQPYEFPLPDSACGMGQPWMYIQTGE